jgi:uroporphyrinogen decarboxylase
MILMSGPEEVRAETLKTLESFGAPADGVGHVFNLGHGISQFTPPENVAVLVETVHSYSKRQRAGNASASSL